MEIPYVQPITQLLRHCLFKVLIQPVKITSLKQNPNQAKGKRKCFHCIVSMTCGQFLKMQAVQPPRRFDFGIMT